MKATLHFFGKFLICLLAFTSQGGVSTFAFHPSEISFSTEDSETQLQAAQPLFLVYEQQEFQEIPEPSENTFDGSSEARFTELHSKKGTKLSNKFPFFNRDLRAEISAQIYPTHFFL